MKNLDQIRAANAIAHRQRIADSKEGGDAVSGFPMLVLTDGLLAALAFATEWTDATDTTRQPRGDEDMRRRITRTDKNGEEKNIWQQRKNPGEYTVARALAAHLATARNPVTTWQTADELLEGIAAENTDILLRRATAEAVQFLNYLKRFVA